MYDEVAIEHPMPDGAVHDGKFQTKELDRLMENYTITSDGRLVLHSVRKEFIPEEERPYYGTEEWDESPMAKLFGCVRSIPIGDVEIDFHGDLHLIGEYNGDEYRRFVARFSYGKLDYIKEINDQ
jgi:hypothetical protein